MWFNEKVLSHPTTIPGRQYRSQLDPKAGSLFPRLQTAIARGLTGGEDVKRDLTADRVGKAEVSEFLLEDLDKLGSASALLVPGLELVSLLGSAWEEIRAVEGEKTVEHGG